MISLRETIQESLTLDIKSAVTEWIKSDLEIVLEFMFSKMSEKDSEHCYIY